MGTRRSSRGCLTCRKRHVKCDESHPRCRQCIRRGEECLYQGPIRFKSPILGSRPRVRKLSSRIAAASPTTLSSSSELCPGPVNWSLTDNDDSSTSPYSGTETTSPPVQQNAVSEALGFDASVEQRKALRTGSVGGPSCRFSLLDAIYIHHFATELGRWLDCTDPLRQFTVKIPELVADERILLLAVTCFAARHMKHPEKAATAHEEAIKLLISKLDAVDVAADDALLCSIVILRVFEQLDVSDAGSDHERHLAGCSALLRSSQGLQVDPAIPILRHAAFWVYVRQAMYNACVYQQPPDVDPATDVAPMVIVQPTSFADSLLQEAAFTNSLVWLTTKIMHFCFHSGSQDMHERLSQWQSLSIAVDQWQAQRPPSFEPIWIGEASTEHCFPVVFLKADWHVMAFVFFHLSRMLLLAYQPKPRFAVRPAGTIDDKDSQAILQHALIMCGACQSMSAVVPAMIALCHTCFIWAPLMVEHQQQDALLQLLLKMESDHAWPTLWIINSLKHEWQLA